MDKPPAPKVLLTPALQKSVKREVEGFFKCGLHYKVSYANAATSKKTKVAPTTSQPWTIQSGPRIPPGSAATTVTDRTDIELVTIDPPGSMDLDQAVHTSQTSDGWRVHYAIADVAAWVTPGGAVDRESHERGFTMYSPDGRAPLLPTAISENAASLLPDVDRQSLLWTIDLDDSGAITDAHLERAVVRSRAKLSYRDATALVGSGEAPMPN